MHRGTRRTVFAVAAAELVPVPLLDTWLQNQARRWLVRTVAGDRAVPLTEDEVRALADAPLAPVRRMLLWPVKTLLKKVFFVFGLVAAVKEAWAVVALPDRVGACPAGAA
ncbi:MAG: hypothetical protein H6737_28025 [Alphaproteobacteria bacterium]|nr:hypothetical protein [Alphaproteobacteria bacterium]